MPSKYLRLHRLSKITTALIKNDCSDLTARQFAVFLICYLDPNPQTVRQLAEQINVSPATMVQTLTRLYQRKLLRRRGSIYDRRKIYIEQTLQGSKYFDKIRNVIAQAFAETEV